jgi:protein-disulfide isomerase
VRPINGNSLVVAGVVGLVTALWLHGPVGVGAAPGTMAQVMDRDQSRTRGNPNAPITLIEYSDFTCGFCRRFFLETWPKINAKYVQTGKVRFMYRDFPRSAQGTGVVLALAARCAGEQNRYWQMHDRLFQGGAQHDMDGLQRHAASVGVRADGFAQCLRDAKYLESINVDHAEGVGIGFRGTPGFVLVRTAQPDKEPPIVIPGAFPFDVFEEQIDRLLKKSSPTQR